MTTAKPNQTTYLLPPGREKLLLIILAAVQFTSMVDFMICVPLGPQFMDVFHISTSQFETIVSSYALSAGVAGLLGGFFMDRFDRKSVLLFIYAGFAIGTFCCGVAPTYHLLVAARIFAGAFGGICGSVIYSIVGDVIPMERRGRAMGLVQTSYSLASILGVPAGLLIANRYSWNISFFSIAALTIPIMLVSAAFVPSLRHHLENKQAKSGFAKTWAVMSEPNHLKAFAFMAALTAAGWCVIPYVPTYMVKNVGLAQKNLMLLYICGGTCTVFSNNIVGRLSDKYGKQKVFIIISVIFALPMLLVTHLPRVPAYAAIATFAFMMVFVSSRMVPAIALMTGVVEARFRGGFMSINASVQQFTLGLAAYFTGFLMGQNDKGELTGFPLNGFVSILFAWIGIYLTRYLKPHKPVVKATPEPLLAEG